MRLGLQIISEVAGAPSPSLGVLHICIVAGHESTSGSAQNPAIAEGIVVRTGRIRAMFLAIASLLRNLPFSKFAGVVQNSPPDVIGTVVEPNYQLEANVDRNRLSPISTQ